MGYVDRLPSLFQTFHFVTGRVIHHWKPCFHTVLQQQPLKKWNYPIYRELKAVNFLWAVVSHMMPEYEDFCETTYKFLNCLIQKNNTRITRLFALVSFLFCSSLFSTVKFYKKQVSRISKESRMISDKMTNIKASMNNPFN